LDFLSPYESKIPDDLKDEIYQAEANTPAAADRGQRVAVYAVIAFVFIFFAFFNGFLTELRADVDETGNKVDLVEAGFGWVQDNFLFRFVFLNKIGGGICLLGGAGAGLLAEAELDTKRINSEKIYEELERRREAKMKKKSNKNTTPKAVAVGSSKKKKRPGKEAKRLGALLEIVAEEDTAATTKEPEVTETEEPVAEEKEVVAATDDDKKEGGLFGGMKDFYDKADAMAASQALLLNKKLEDVGVVEKITDETGLKVIGKEEAAKLKEKQEAGESNSEKKD
jgi:hypothetical protein